MALAGYCTSCGSNVYLTPEGGCPQGHGPEAIQNPYQVPDPVPVPAAAPRKSNTLLIVAVVVGVLLLGGCATAAVLFSLAAPTFENAQQDAQMRACFANQRVICGAAEQMKAADGSYPSAVSDLVDAGYITEIPECLAGGEYEYSPIDASVECSVHGAAY